MCFENKYPTSLSFRPTRYGSWNKLFQPCVDWIRDEMAEVAWKFREVSSSKHTKCCRDKYNLIFPLLRFGALIILLRKTFRYAVNDLVLDWSKNWQVKSRVLMNFIFWLNTKFSRDLFVTSWACTIGIWSTLTQLNLIRQIYALCYNLFWWLFL